MASFVEQATLKVNDQSSAAIRKINAELKKLERTAKSLKSIRVDLKINTSGLQAANRQLNALANNMARMRGQTLNLRVNSSGLTQAQNHINRLRQQAARPINIHTQGTGGGGPPGTAGGPNRRRGVRQTGTAHQYGNFSVGRGAASVVVGGTAYAVAANVTRSAVSGVMDSEDARMRLRQSGFDKGRTDDKTPATDYLMAAARKIQDEFGRVPAAAIADAAVEQLNAIKANNGTFADYEQALRRIGTNAQIMGMTFKDPQKGAENARQLERVSQIMGKDVDDKEIRKVQEATMRAVIASGGEIQVAEAVRALQQMGSSIIKTMSPTALGDLLMVRDEGGRASTAEWRTTIQELMRGSLGKGDKASMARMGLRKKHGLADPEVVREAATDLVGFTEKRIVPILTKAGVADKSSAEIATFLDENVGYTTVAARGLADIVTSLRDGELQRQRAAQRYVDLDPRLGDKTFRGGSERLSASFQTAMGRALDKSGGAFTEAIAPFSLSMDKAGKAAEKGNYGEAALEMTKGVAQMMGGPAGAIITAMTAASAARTLLDPTSTPIEKGAAMLVTGSSALLTAAGAIANYFGGSDPNQDLAHQQTLQKSLPEEIKSLQERAKEAQTAVDADPTNFRKKKRLADINMLLTSREIALRDVERNVIAAQARVDALKAQEKAAKDEEAAEMDRLRRESGLDPKTGQPTVTPPAAAGPISAETVKALQQLSAGGGLAGVKSITALLAALNQPTSVKSREDLATSLGYTGPLGGSAAMNTFLLNFFKKLATAIPEPPKEPVTPPPPAVTPPPPPPPPPAVVEPPTEPVVVEPPKAPVVVDQPILTVPTRPPSVSDPLRPPPPLFLPNMLSPFLRGPPITMTPPATPMSFDSVIDTSPVKAQFASLFTSGATTIGESGTTVGSNAASELDGRAGSIGGAIGSAAAAIISAATVNVQIPSMPGQGTGARPNTGSTTVV